MHGSPRCNRRRSSAASVRLWRWPVHRSAAPAFRGEVQPAGSGFGGIAVTADGAAVLEHHADNLDDRRRLINKQAAARTQPAAKAAVPAVRRRVLDREVVDTHDAGVDEKTGKLVGAVDEHSSRSAAIDGQILHDRRQRRQRDGAGRP